MLIQHIWHSKQMSINTLIAQQDAAMIVLITGCNGFIGKNMVSYFSTETDWKIEGWSWDPDKSTWPNIVRYDWVIHLGADTHGTNAEQSLCKNLDFSQWLFTECQKHGVHLQYASSGEVYGKSKNNHESAECKPESTLAWTKFLFDRWAFRAPHHAFVQGFRYFDVYGKWQHDTHLFSQWISEARDTKMLHISEEAKHITRDWVWVGDICRLHLDFILHVKGSGIWNVGSGLTHTDFDIADEIATNTGAKLIVNHNEYVSDRPRHSKPDITRLKETIGKRKWLNVYEWINLE